MAHAVNSRFQGEGRGSGAREGTVGEVRGKSDACGCPRSQMRRHSFRKVEQVRCGLRPGASSCLRRPGPPSALEEQRAQPWGEAGAPGLLSTKTLLLLDSDKSAASLTGDGVRMPPVPPKAPLLELPKVP